MGELFFMLWGAFPESNYGRKFCRYKQDSMELSGNAFLVDVCACPKVPIQEILPFMTPYIYSRGKKTFSET